MSFYNQIPENTDFSDDDYKETEDSNYDDNRPSKSKKHFSKPKQVVERNIRDNSPHRKLKPMQKEKYKKNKWLDSEEE